MVRLRRSLPENRTTRHRIFFESRERDHTIQYDRRVVALHIFPIDAEEFPTVAIADGEAGNSRGLEKALSFPDSEKGGCTDVGRSIVRDFQAYSLDRQFRQ
jgi:hypothetical protein